MKVMEGNTYTLHCGLTESKTSLVINKPLDLPFSGN